MEWIMDFVPPWDFLGLILIAGSATNLIVKAIINLNFTLSKKLDVINETLKNRNELDNE